MYLKRTFGDMVFDFLNIVFMLFLMLITLYPFWYVVCASLSNPADLAANSGLLWKPMGFSMDAYKAVMDNRMIMVGYRNTIFYLIAGTALSMLLTSIGAYVLSRKNFFWKNFITNMIIVTMFFGGGLIPTYLLIKGMNLIDNPLVMIIPGAISSWNLFIMRTNFASVPESLIESAVIDGAKEGTILFKIILPLSLPVLAVMTLYYGVGYWNTWFNAMIYLRSKDLYPLQLVLREIVLSNDTNNMLTGTGAGDQESVSETIKYATIMVATIPILCAYPFLQKYFVKGVMVGAIKG